MIPCPVDRAQHHVECELEKAIAAARMTTPCTLAHSGECHHCGEDLVDDLQLFCNGKCAELFERGLKNVR